MKQIWCSIEFADGNNGAGIRWNKGDLLTCRREPVIYNEVERNLSSYRERFNRDDRRRVIRSIQEHYGVSLLQVGRRPKWLRDSLGKNWCILGGVGSWHGIPEEIVDEERVSQIEGALILVVKRSSTLEVFSGKLSNIVKVSNKLYRNRRGDYQFDYKEMDGRLGIRGVGANVLMTMSKLLVIS